jgi:hypothetical protein
MKRFLQDNGLTVALVTMFLLSLVGMIWSGYLTSLDELREHASPPIGLLGYLHSGQFLSALSENWESEFLQMSAYVMLTAMLFQRGSAESRDPDDPHRPGDEVPEHIRRLGRLPALLFSYSLAIALGLLFAASLMLHWWGSFVSASEEAARHGELPEPMPAYILSSRLWFESFQN